MRVVVAIVVWIAAIAAAAGVSTAVSNSIHPTIDATSVTAPQRQSMFQGDNFVKAWATIKSHLGANITTEQVVVYPGYVNVQAERARGQGVPGEDPADQVDQAQAQQVPGGQVD